MGVDGSGLHGHMKRAQQRRGISIVLAIVGLLLAFAAAPAAAQVGTPSVSLSTPQAGATDVVYTVTFTNHVQLLQANSDYVEITAPTGSKLNSGGGFYTISVDGGTPSGPDSVIVNPLNNGKNNVADIYVPFDIAAGANVQIVASGATNPTTSGTLSVGSSTDTTSSSTNVAITAAGAVTNVTASPTTTSAGAVDVKYTVTFKSSGAIVGGHSSEADGYIELTAPPNTVLNASGSDYTISTGGTPMTPNGVVVDPNNTNATNVADLYVPLDIPANSAVTVIASGVTNPTSTQSGQFLVSTSSDTTAGSSSAIEIGAATQVSQLSATSSDMTAGASQVVYTATFKVNQQLTGGGKTGVADGYVELTAPPGSVFSGSSGDYLVTLAGGPTLSPDGAIVNPIPPGSSTGLGNNVVDLYMPFNVLAGSTVTISAGNTLNPTSANSAGTLSVSTSSDATPLSTAFPITPATPVTNPSAGASTSAAGASNAIYTTSFKVTHPLTGGAQGGVADGYVQLTAPAGALFNASSGDYIVTDGIRRSTPDGAIVNPSPAGGNNPLGTNVVDVYMPFAIAAGDTVTIAASGIINPSAADPGGQVTISTSSDTVPVSTPLPITASTAVSGLSAGANTMSAGASDVAYAATFTVDGPLYGGNQNGVTDSFIQLQGPTGSVFNSNSSYYTAAYGATTLNPDGVTVNPPPPGGNTGPGNNVVDLYLPFNVPARATISVTATGVTNPTAANGGGAFAVTTSSDASAASTPFRISAATAVTEVAASMNNTTPSATGVDYRATFRATSPITGGQQNVADGFVELTGPPGSTFSADGSAYTVTDGFRSLPPDQVAVDPVAPGNQLGPGNNVVDVYVPFPIHAGDTVEVDTSATNPKPADAPRTFAVSTSSDSSAVAATLGLLPTLNKTVGVTPAGGRVIVKPPGKKTFTALNRGEIVSIGSAVDTSSGTASIKAAFDPHGDSNTADFNGGLFSLSQSLVTVKHKKVPFTFATLPPLSKHDCVHASLKARRRPRHHVHTHSNGGYSTATGQGSAIENGTAWTTSESCAGTLFAVQQGSITVHDFPHHRTFVLSAGHQFLVHPGRGG